MANLKWKRFPALDSEEAKTPLGTYELVRTYSDKSKLWFNGELLNIASGSHAENKLFAQEHYDKQKGE